MLVSVGYGEVAWDFGVDEKDIKHQLATLDDYRMSPNRVRQ